MDRDRTNVIGFMILFLLSLGLGLVIGATGSREIHSMKCEAIKRGYAEWKVDENGGTTFSWK